MKISLPGVILENGFILYSPKSKHTKQKDKKIFFDACYPKKIIYFIFLKKANTPSKKKKIFFAACYSKKFIYFIFLKKRTHQAKKQKLFFAAREWRRETGNGVK